MTDSVAFDTKRNNKVSLDSLKETMVYKLRVKILRGLDLTKEERLWLTEQMNFTDSTRYICLEGWCFDFRPIMNIYQIWDCGQWCEYAGTDIETVVNVMGCDIEDATLFPPMALSEPEKPRVCEYTGRLYEEMPVTGKKEWQFIKDSSENVIKKSIEYGKNMLAVRTR